MPPALLQRILKVAASGPILAAAGMLAMASGVVDVDPTLGAIANLYAVPLGLPLKPFLAFVGTAKLLGVLKLWGIGPMPSLKVAVLGLACPASAAVYGHYVVEGPAAAIAPVVYLGILGVWYSMETSGSGSEYSLKKSS
ncbi:MAG: hypothetical protein SGILL_006252 [Bacillariaceae sp.]